MSKDCLKTVAFIVAILSTQKEIKQEIVQRKTLILILLLSHSMERDSWSIMFLFFKKVIVFLHLYYIFLRNYVQLGDASKLFKITIHCKGLHKDCISIKNIILK